MKSMLVALALVGCTNSEPAEPDLDPVPPDDPVPVDPPAPLAGPIGQWKWFDVPGAVCGNGGQTGIGVNTGTSDDVVIYLEGGGLCWDDLTCNAAHLGVTVASYFTSGYTGETFQHAIADGPHTNSIFDRTLATNPYKDASIIYVPYCTGDLHTGDTTKYLASSNTLAHFAGGKNLDLALEKIVATFPSPSRVTLSGSSAGGYGALLGFDRVHRSFPTSRVDLVDDSGPLFAIDPFIQLGFPVWNTNRVIPPECAGCFASYTNLYGYLSTTYPDSRFALLSHDQDEVISLGNLLLPPAFYLVMKDFTEHQIGTHPNWKYFVAGGLAHTFVYDILEPSNDVVLADWLTQMTTDDPSWSSTTSIIH